MSAVSTLASRLGLTRVPWLRHFALRTLSFFGQHDAVITHHWVAGKKVRLHRFKHKGYWFHGRGREETIMRSFAALINEGDTVIELGGHIGYISMYFASLVGLTGRVAVFEPSPENLTYTRSNLADEPAVTLIEEAASDKAGRATFFVERLTGQNSTLVEDYSVFSRNRKRAFADGGYEAIEVSTTTVDDFVRSSGACPNFIKIDVEGAELAALRGSTETLRRFRPRLMVEVTSDRDAVLSLLTELGYRVLGRDLNPLDPSDHSPELNLFFIHREDAGVRH